MLRHAGVGIILLPSSRRGVMVCETQVLERAGSWVIPCNPPSSWGLSSVCLDWWGASLWRGESHGVLFWSVGLGIHPLAGPSWLGSHSLRFAGNLLGARSRQFELQPELLMMLGRNPTEGAKMAGGMARSLAQTPGGHTHTHTHTHTDR